VTRSWAVRVKVELLIDDKAVGQRSTIEGALTEHVPLDEPTFVRTAARVGKAAARTLAREQRLLR
jgi:hypothetical protein